MAGDWIDTTIGAQVTLQRGIDITKSAQRVGSIPVVSSGGVSSFHDTAAATGPGVILGRKGVVGSVYFVSSDYWPHDTTLWVKDFHGNDRRFVYYYFKWLTPRIAAMDVGSANPTLNRNHVHPIEVSWPPCDEQHAIAHILGALDDKIDLNRRTSETLEAMARALFKSWFVDFDPVRAKADGHDPGRPKHLSDLFPSHLVDSEIGAIPEGWSYRSLGEIVELTRGTTYKGNLKDHPGPVLLGLACISRNGGFREDKLSTYGGESEAKHLLGPGDLFVSLKDVTQSADLLGAVARVPDHVKLGRLTQDTVRLKFMCAETSSHIVYRTLLTPVYRDYCRSHATGTTNLGLAREDFLAYPVIQPSAAVQSAFDSAIDNIEARLSGAAANSRTLGELRDTLLPKLISGEIRVKDAERFVSRAV